MHTTEPQLGTHLLQLFRSGQRMVYRKGNVLLRGDFPAERLFYIEQGYIKAYSLNDRGEDYVHLLLGAGDIFPLIGLITNSVRDVFYEAMDDCVVYTYPKDRLQELLDSDPPITRDVLWQSLRQLTIYSDRIDNLEFKYTQERLVYRLLVLLGRFGERQHSTGHYIIRIPLSQQVLASSINASRESVNRELERLAHKGIISYNRHTITINDLDGLIKFLPGKLNIDLWQDIKHVNGILRAINHF